MRYYIHENNMEKLTKKMQHIGNKCKKLGVDFKFDIVGTEFREVGRTSSKYFVVEAEGVAVVNGWMFVGAVDYNEGGNVVRALEEVPERYYKEKPVCDHCHVKRERVHTYIIKNVETGEYKQVGKACLREYTNGLSAEMVAEMLSIDDVCREATVAVGCATRYYSVRDALAYAIASIKCYGYKKTELGDESTKTDVIKNYYFKPCFCFDSSFENLCKQADEMIAWAKGLQEDFGYLYNLKSIANSQYIPENQMGILVSMPVAYAKAQEKKAKEEKQKLDGAKSDYVGNVGDKITVDVAEFKCVGWYETEYGYNSSLVHIYVFTDKEGNQYKWSTSCGGFEEGEVKTVVGKVKAHDEYKGVKQTVMTRCKVA